MLGYGSLSEWLLASAIVMTGAALQGSAGFGFALLRTVIVASFGADGFSGGDFFVPGQIRRQG